MTDERQEIEIEAPERVARDRQMILEAKARGPLAKLWAYTKLSGPGWLQSAITLGGGSLTGSLYLGVLAGFGLLWLQPLAMILGVIMLSAIGYVALSTGERPFRAINRHVNPVLGWGWLVATVMANMVWCMPQFALGTAAIQQNLAPAVLGEEAVEKRVAAAGDDVTPEQAAEIRATAERNQKLICVAILFATGAVIVWFYNTGGWGIKLFELILKGMVAVIVMCFFGVVIKMTTNGALDWSQVLAGFVPDLSLLNQPAAALRDTVAATGEFAKFWGDRIVREQQQVMITAAATAVGINMTFLLPYSMLARGWNKDFRGLAIFDLSTGLFIPFVLATSCVVIAAASQFHGEVPPGLLGERDSDGNPISPPANLVSGFNGLLDARLAADMGPANFEKLKADKAALEAARKDLPEADRRIAAMLVRRDAYNLAKSLERLAGRETAHYVFGIGVLGMAVSTIIILMLINGFAFCEAVNVEPKGNMHRLGAFIAGLSGATGPFVFQGDAKFWLAVPTSMFGMMLLPIAYLTFFLMMNSKSMLGERRPRGIKRVLWNTLMLVALAAAAFGSFWSIHTSDYPTVLYSVLGAFLLIVLIVQFTRGRGDSTGTA